MTIRDFATNMNPAAKAKKRSRSLKDKRLKKRRTKFAGRKERLKNQVKMLVEENNRHLVKNARLSQYCQKLKR